MKLALCPWRTAKRISITPSTRRVRCLRSCKHVRRDALTPALSRGRGSKPKTSILGLTFTLLPTLLSQQINKIRRADKGRQQTRRDLIREQHHSSAPVRHHQHHPARQGEHRYAASSDGIPSFWRYAAPSTQQNSVDQWSWWPWPSGTPPAVTARRVLALTPCRPHVRFRPSGRIVIQRRHGAQSPAARSLRSRNAPPDCRWRCTLSRRSSQDLRHPRIAARLQHHQQHGKGGAERHPGQQHPVRRKPAAA